MELGAQCLAIESDVDYRVTLNFLILSNNFLGSPDAKCCLTGSNILFKASVTAGFKSDGYNRPDK